MSKKFRVTSTMVVSIYTVVEAENDDEAIELALERDVQGLCFHCSSGQDADEEWRVSELDGAPDDDNVDATELESEDE